ncbi:beta-3 adrenergic receptor-like [Stylophora pistillata]|uniref:beta-3 adrenergic receptor-like n=1 Tax=Stylophora pistillata TaxID=50429 RepID=UPI000C03EBD2|nr:beta-3 adrenergic receptor-like [Stylophora pistillata]
MELPHRTSGLIAFQSTSLLLIDIIAIGGNVFICLATARNPSLRTSTNLWVTALAIADLTRSCIAAPLTVATLICGRWNYGSGGCIIQGFFTYYLTLVSLLTMAFMAVNRYCRVVKPALYLKIFTRKRCVAALISLWTLMALTVSIPVLVGWAEFAFHVGYAACVLHFHKPSLTVIFLTLDAGLILIPCTLTIAGCYLKVSRAVREHNDQVIPSLQGAPNLDFQLVNRATIEEIRVTKTLFLLVSTFALCWIPAYVIGFLSRGNLVHISLQGALAVTYLVGLNSACNPFIYGYMNRSFRVELWKLIPCKRTENQVVPHVLSKDTSPQTYTRSQAVVVTAKSF